MKLLVATRADEKISPMTSLTLPLIQKYAKDCGADFHILNQEPPAWTPEHPPRAHYRIMKFYDLFEEYDRILSVDCDLLICKNCPNIFETVDPDKVGSIYEDVGHAQDHRRGQIRAAQEQFGDVGWTEGYINTGFAVFSKKHRDIFQPINGQYFMDFGIDDVHLCWQIHKHGFEIQQLPYQWNHMTMFSEDWNNHADRFQSHVIHYAGAGIFDHEFSNRTEQIRHDMERIYGKND
jgi:lipopolysaccharide biosynthesis glycosyltransferase